MRDRQINQSDIIISSMQASACIILTMPSFEVMALGFMSSAK